MHVLKGCLLQFYVSYFRYIFISDWGANAHIERAWMDGSNRETIVNDQLGWPNGLTIDYVMREVFWADARLDYIGAVNYDGSGRRKVVIGVRHPFAITLYENYLYYTDWNHRGVIRADKSDKQSSTKMIIRGNLTRPMDIHVYHISRQPATVNPCEVNNGGCQHLCVIAPAHQPSCLCNYGYHLSADNKTCDSIDTFLLYARSAEVRGISLKVFEKHDTTIPILGMNNVVGVDFDAREEKVYFSDVKLGKIGRSRKDGTSSAEYIVTENLQNPDGISVDWIGRNIFWTDAKTRGKPEIAVAKLNGDHRRTLLTDGLRSPRAITVHPVQG